jgi:hypothetical protein
VYSPNNVVLDQAPHRLAVSGDFELVIGVDYVIAFCPADLLLRQVEIDLVAIKVSVE